MKTNKKHKEKPAREQYSDLGVIPQRAKLVDEFLKFDYHNRGDLLLDFFFSQIFESTEHNK